MKDNVLKYLNQLEMYKTAIKNLHWDSKSMSEHKLWDDIASSVSENQDEIAEIAQGVLGTIELNKLKPESYTISNSKSTLNDMLKDTKEFYSTIDGDDYIGLRSVVESWIGELNKFVYLMDFCLKEDIKRRLVIKEMKSKLDRLTEADYRRIINVSLKKIL